MCIYIYIYICKRSVYIYICSCYFLLIFYLEGARVDCVVVFVSLIVRPRRFCWLHRLGAFATQTFRSAMSSCHQCWRCHAADKFCWRICFCSEFNGILMGICAFWIFANSNIFQLIDRSLFINRTTVFASYIQHGWHNPINSAKIFVCRFLPTTFWSQKDVPVVLIEARWPKVEGPMVDQSTWPGLSQSYILVHTQSCDSVVCLDLWVPFVFCRDWVGSSTHETTMTQHPPG